MPWFLVIGSIVVTALVAIFHKSIERFGNSLGNNTTPQENMPAFDPHTMAAGVMFSASQKTAKPTAPASKAAELAKNFDLPRDTALASFQPSQFRSIKGPEQ